MRSYLWENKMATFFFGLIAFQAGWPNSSSIQHLFKLIEG